MYNLIRDQDTTVIANAINALDEILKDDGGIVVT